MMHEVLHPLRKAAHNPLSDSLTHAHRQVLAILVGRTPMAEQELAAELAGDSRVEPVRSISRKEAHINLRHVYLPKLAEAGYITWDENDATVTVATHPTLDDCTAKRGNERGNEEMAGVVEDARNARRRIILTILETGDEPRERADLAREIAAQKTDEEPSVEAVEEVLLTLHHVDLPKLESAGLVQYDADEGKVTPDHCWRQ